MRYTLEFAAPAEGTDLLVWVRAIAGSNKTTNANARKALFMREIITGFPGQSSLMIENKGEIFVLCRISAGLE